MDHAAPTMVKELWILEKRAEDKEQHIRIRRLPCMTVHAIYPIVVENTIHPISGECDNMIDC